MKKIILILMAFAGSINIRAQSVGPKTLNAAGGTGTAGSVEIDWSVGEMTLVSTFSGGSVVVTQGVLQPTDAWPVDVGNTALLKQLEVFPNPASSVVNIRYAAQAAGTLTYRLMDVTGKELAEKNVDVKQGIITEQLNISTLACATYMLEVSIRQADGKNETTSYKIQKIK
jgi:hypothetical protein